MESKKINHLATNLAPVTTDLTVVGNPTTGELKKITLAQIAALFGAGLTSVGMVVPSGFSVTPSLLTSSGTFTITGAGSSTDYIDGTGAIQPFPTLLSSDKLIHSVRNNSGATITKGTIVYINGALGNKPTIGKALATSDSTSAQTYGVVQADIANNADGNIVVIGDVENLDTSAVTEGTQLYLSGTTAGAYTTTKSYAPIHLVYVAVVLRSHPTLGIIGVKIQNGYEMDELHNVSAQSPANNDGLFYNSTTSLWEKNTIAGVLGYTPVTSARTISTTSPLSGGGDLSANRTLSISQANTTTSGYLSNTDWNTFNNKQGTITLTTTGSSGSSTFVTNTLNIPTYTLTGLGGQPLSTNLTSLAGLTYASTSFVKMTAAGTFSLDTNTYYLASNPSGYTSNVGTVTSVAALTLGTTGTDLSSSVATGTTTPVITLNVPTASATNRGALSSADWTTFNSKQGAITLTTTGSSGSATLVTNTLNIPTYTLAGLGGQPSSTNLTSLSGLTYVSTSFVKMTAAGTFSLDTNTYLTANQSITLSGDVSGTGTTAITTAIGTNKVTNAMLAQIATASFLGRVTAATGNVETLTATQATSILNVFTSTLKGLTPSSGGGTTNYLRADGTWAAPTGTGFTNPMTTLGDVIYGDTGGTATRLAGNITAVKQFLSQTGTGTISAAPSWSAISGSDITGAALTSTNDTNVTITLGGTPATSLLRAASITLGWTGTLADARIASAATWNAKESALTFSAPLSRTTNTISIPAATTSVNGYLTSTDWNTFNGKQAAITLTTTGTSGAATLVGATLNIPQYSGVGMSIGGTITSATAGSVLFAGTGGILAQDNALFFWDDTNNRLLINTNTSVGTESLQVNSNIRAINGTFVGSGTNKTLLESSGYLVNGTNSIALLNLDGTWSTTGSPTAILLNITNTGSGASSKLIDLQIGSASKFYIDKNGYGLISSRLGIGSTAPTITLDVIRGTAGTMARDFYESAAFSYNGDTKLGVYTSSATATDGAALYLGQTNLLNSASQYGGFELQYRYNSSTTENFRINYVSRLATGAVSTSVQDILLLSKAGQLKLGSYTSATSFTGTAAGYLAFDTGGNIITTTGSGGGGTDFYTTNGTLTSARTITANGNLLTYSDNKNGSAAIYISNTTSGSLAQVGLRVESDASSGYGTFGKTSTLYTPVVSTVTNQDLSIVNYTAGNLVLLNSVTTGSIEFAIGTGSTPVAVITSNGHLLINNTADGLYHLDVVGDANITGKITIGAGTATKAPLDLTSSGAVLKTTPIVGDIEVDSNGFIFYTQSARRGIIAPVQWICNTATKTYTATTTSQNMFDAGSAGASTFTAVAGTYFFEAYITLTALSATANAVGFGLLVSSAVISNINYTAIASKTSTPATPTAPTQCQITTGAATAVTSSNTSTAAVIKITGVVRFSTGGTVTPVISQIGGTSASVLGIGSYVKFIAVGVNTDSKNPINGWA